MLSLVESCVELSFDEDDTESVDKACVCCVCVEAEDSFASVPVVDEVCVEPEFFFGVVSVEISWESEVFAGAASADEICAESGIFFDAAFKSFVISAFLFSSFSVGDPV